MKKIISVVGARPNFMKVAPIHKALLSHNQHSSKAIKHLICHTGQHYDDKMSKIFFDDLELPKPDIYLGAGSGSHAEQTAKIMIEFEKVLFQEKPDLVIVVGDVNSTIACSLTASKLNILTAQVEAGLRSFDRQMPEEINRILTDAIADYLFVSEKSGLINLRNEGVSDHKVFFVGNVMIDSLVHYLLKTDTSNIVKLLGIERDNYVLVTLHRPSNVDNLNNLSSIISLLNNLAKKRKVIFPVHPRTKKNLEDFNLISNISHNIVLSDPIGYIDFITLTKNAELILTDSGGIQEESTYLGVQCITIRATTERPITVDIGTNHLVGEDYKLAAQVALEILDGKKKQGKIPEKWDGKTAERIIEILTDNLL